MVEKICFYGLMQEDFILLFGKLCNLLGKKTLIADKSKNQYLFMALSGNDQCELAEFDKGSIFNNGIQVVNARGYEQLNVTDVDLYIEYLGFDGLSFEPSVKNIILAENMPAVLHLFMEETSKKDDKSEVFLVIRAPKIAISDEKYVCSLLNILEEHCVCAGISEEDYDIRKRIQNLQEIKLQKLSKELRDSLLILCELLGFGEVSEINQMIKKEGKKVWGKLSFSGHQPPGMAV